MKRRYGLIIFLIVVIILVQVVCIDITPALKKIANKEIDRFCQIVINNTPLPVELDQQKLIKVKRDGDIIKMINFNTNYASNIGSMIVNELEGLFHAIETGTFQKSDNSFHQRLFQKISDAGGVIARLPIGAFTNNPFLAHLGPKVELRYKTISAITSSLEREIKNYGVNHVMVSLKLVVKVKMMVILPFYNEEFKHQYDYPLVMEIIEGEVPNWYQK